MHGLLYLHTRSLTRTHAHTLRDHHLKGVISSMCQDILIILILDKPFWEGVKVACVCANRQCALISEWMCCLHVCVRMWTLSSMINAAQQTGPQPCIKCDKCFKNKKKRKKKINQVLCFSPNKEPDSRKYYIDRFKKYPKRMYRWGLTARQKTWMNKRHLTLFVVFAFVKDTMA